MLHTSLGHDYQVVCDKTWKALDARDCFSALRQSPTGHVQESWAPDGSPGFPSVYSHGR